MKRYTSTLTTRNVQIGDRRTSLRLEPFFWETLDRICDHRNGIAHDTFVAEVAEHRKAGSLTAAVREAILRAAINGEASTRADT